MNFFLFTNLTPINLDAYVGCPEQASMMLSKAL
jgi:hypothetical protein